MMNEKRLTVWEEFPILLKKYNPEFNDGKEPP